MIEYAYKLLSNSETGRDARRALREVSKTSVPDYESGLITAKEFLKICAREGDCTPLNVIATMMSDLPASDFVQLVCAASALEDGL